MKPPPPKKTRIPREEITEVVQPVVHRLRPTEGEEENIDDPSPDLSIADVEKQMAKLIQAATYEPQVQYWLDTGDQDLNAALGSRKNGIPYGKIIEIRGKEHGGKTCLATILAGLAQKDGAAAGYMDLERSRDAPWAKKLGYDLGKALVLYPKLLLGDAKKRDRLQSAEDMFDRAEVAMQVFRMNGYKKQFWMLDSVANIVTEMQEEAGVTGRNMRVNMDRAQFLSYTLPRWAGLAANYNATIFLINQLRNNPAAWGNPETSPGGRALNHACAVRATVGRVKKGHLLKNGMVVGLAAKVVNFKNKAGQGSQEGDKAAFKVRWDSDPASVKFMSLEEAEEV